MEAETRLLLLRLVAWVNKNCQSFANRESLFEIGIDPDKIDRLYKALEIEGHKLGQGFRYDKISKTIQIAKTN